MDRLVLASQSPRRQELLAALGVPCDIVPGLADETLPAAAPLFEALRAVARRKAEEVRRRVGSHRWVLAADTAVVVGEEVLGKPRDRAQAERMLRQLSGRTHRVVTAVALLGPSAESSAEVETFVAFQELSERQIRWYTSLDEPYDKAGGYAIQGSGAFLVESIRGSYTNVVGLPMTETARLLEQAGLAPWGSDA